MLNLNSIIFFVLQIVCCYSLTTHTSGIIAALHRYFYSGCTFLLYSENNGMVMKKYITQLQSQLSTELCATTVLSVDCNLTEVVQSCQRIHPLFVLHPEDEAAKLTFLPYVSDRQFSQAIWLLFLDKEILLTEYLRDIDIPFDCEMLVAQPEEDRIVLNEVYRLSPQLPLQMHKFGNWSSSVGLIGPELTFHQRRRNLTGLTLKTAVANVFNTKIVEEIDNKPIKISGFYGELWNMLEKELNFTSDFYKSRDTFFGSLADNGSWNGMVGMVQRGEVDFACAKFLMTPARMQVVDFLSTVEETKTRLIIKAQRSVSLRWDEFLRPFSTRLWMLELFVMILIAVCFAVTHHVGRRDEREPGSHSTVRNLHDALFYTFATFCQQGQSVTPRTLSCRMVVLTSYLTAVVLLAGYSAFLISFLATREIRNIPFNSFKQFLADGTYQLGMASHSAHTWNFRNSTDPVMKEIYKTMIAPNQQNFPATDDEGFRRVCGAGNFAYFTYTDLTSQETDAAHCELMEIPHIYIPGSLALTTVKNSPYKGLFNYVILKMRRSGVLKRLAHEHYRKRIQMYETPSPVVHLVQVTPVMTFLAVAVFVSSVLLIIEKRATHICAHLQLGWNRCRRRVFNRNHCHEDKSSKI